jgi:hypothetical protein
MGVTSEIDIRSGDGDLTVVDVPVKVSHPGLETCSHAQVRELPIGIALVSTLLLIAGISVTMTGSRRLS